AIVAYSSGLTNRQGRNRWLCDIVGKWLFQRATFLTTIWRVVTSCPDREDFPSRIAAVAGLKGVCIVTNASYPRPGEGSALRSGRHADPARVATRQFLRWLLDQYWCRDDWLMVPRPPPGAARRLPLERRALFRLLRRGGHCGRPAFQGGRD